MKFSNALAVLVLVSAPAFAAAPSLVRPINDQLVDEGDTLNVQLSATDEDAGDTLSFSQTGLPAAFCSLTDNNNRTADLICTPGFGAAAGSPYSVTVTVSDGNPADNDSETFNIIVGDVNQAPLLDPIGNQPVDEGDTLNVPLSAFDADGDTLTFTASGLPGFCSLTDNPNDTGDLDCTPGFGAAAGSPYSVTVTVSDGNPADNDSETFNIIVGDVNQAPLLDPIGNQPVDEGDTLNVPLSAFDADGDTLTFTASGLPGFCSLTDNPNDTGDLDCTPGFGAAAGSPYSVTVTVSDGNPADNDSETFNIIVGDVNQAPLLDPIGNQPVDEGDTLNVPLSAFDADGDTLTFTASGLPGFCSLTDNPNDTGDLDCTPGFGAAAGSPYSVTVTVSDGNPADNDSETFNIIVGDVNQAPLLDPIGNQPVDEGDTLNVPLSAFDADGDTLTFTASGLPGFCSLTDNPNDTGDLDCTPGFGAAASSPYSVTVTVSDGNPADNDSETFNIIVGDVNQAPLLDPIGNQPVDEGATLNFTATATDADVPAHTLTFSLSGSVPAGASITPGGNFSWTPTEAQGGRGYTFNVLVTDDGSPNLSDSQTITVNVNEVNVAPVLGGIGNRTVNEGATVSFTASASDVDLPANTWSFTLDAGAPAGATISQTSGQFSWTTTEADGPGNFPITVRVTDNGSPNLNDFETITVTVNEVNEAPTANDIEFNVTEGESTIASFNVLSNDTDPDSASPVLTAELVAPPSLDPAFVLNSDGSFSYTHDGSETPSDSFTYRACDNGTPPLCSSPATVTIIVDNVNDAPEIEGQQALSTAEETALLITLADLLVTDVDSDPASFILSVQDGADYTRSGNTITPDLDFNGDLTVPVTVSDGTDSSPVFNLTVTVTAVNDQPVITGQNAVTTPEITEREIVLTDLIVTDPDNTYPTDFTLAVQDGADYTRVGNTITPATDFNGDLAVPVTVTDNSGEANATSAVFNLIVSVSAVNNQPVITAQLPLTTPEDTALTITLADLTVTDADSTYPDDFTLTVQDGTDYTRVDNTITPALDFNGDLTVPVTVNDGEADSPVFNLVVTVTPVNDAPVIVDQAVLTTPEDTSLTVVITDVTVVDPDNVFPGDFTLELFDGTNYTRAGNTITPDLNFNGQLSVPATVSDSELTSAQFILTIDVSSENDQPVLETPIEDQLAIEGTAFSLDISSNFTDADGDPLQFTATNLPASGNLVFDPVTGVISGTPQVEDARDTDPYIIIVTATDGDPATIPAADEFNLNISALDRANVSLDINVAPDPAMLNDELSWTFSASNTVGPQIATNVELTGSFVGSGLSISSTASCTIQAAVDQVTDFDCMLGSLPIGESISVVLTTVTSAVGDVVVFATAANVDPLPLDPNLADNSRQIAVGVAEEFSNGAVEVLGNASVLSMAAGDINGDGAADLVIGSVSGQPIQIYLSDGFRDFVTPPISLPDTSANEGVELADFDNNGTLDLVVANGGGQPDAVYSNDGVGNFTLAAELGSAPSPGGAEGNFAVSALPAPTSSHAVAVADFNSDGNMDIVIATIEGNPVYLGDGFGTFSLYATLGTADSHAIAVDDFDGTAGPDIVYANVGSDSQIWLNNGIDGFASGDSLPIGDAVSVTTGQFGGDARLDLAFGRVPTVNGDVPANPVLINDGFGSFGIPVALLGTSSTNDIHAGDVNRDGLTDLVFINASGVHQIWTATASGFELHSEQIVDGGAIVGVLAELGFTDVDDPGGVDLALGGALQVGTSVYLNDGFGNLGRGDAVPPLLVLNGAASVDVPAGSTYTDAGATAEDNIDGDISSAIVVSAAVNTALVGSYTVTYNVSDFAGNSASPITRTVNVTPAAGTGGGGGGGGAASPYLLLLLMFAACLTAWHANRAIIQVRAQKIK